MPTPAVPVWRELVSDVALLAARVVDAPRLEVLSLFFFVVSVLLELEPFVPLVDEPVVPLVEPLVPEPLIEPELEVSLPIPDDEEPVPLPDRPLLLVPLLPLPVEPDVPVLPLVPLP